MLHPTKVYVACQFPAGEASVKREQTLLSRMTREQNCHTIPQYQIHSRHLLADTTACINSQQPAQRPFYTINLDFICTVPTPHSNVIIPNMAATQKLQQTTIPDYIDSAAKSIPNATWAIVPRSTMNLDEGWHHFTYAHLARAVDSMARWIENTCGVAKQVGQTIGYMG